MSDTSLHNRSVPNALPDTESKTASEIVHLVLNSGTKITFDTADSDGSARSPRSDLLKFTSLKRSLENLFETIAMSDVPSETMEAMLAEVTESVARRQPRGGSLTRSNADFLLGSGVLTGEKLSALEARVSDGELAQKEYTTRLGAIIRTQTAEQVGQRLGISASRVRHRQNDNHLFAFLAGKARHYPLWQFIGEGDRVVPRLSRIIPAFPAGWHPASIEGFMTTPQTDLVSAEGSETTPVEWLASGEDPAAVVAILERIARS